MGLSIRPAWHLASTATPSGRLLSATPTRSCSALACVARTGTGGGVCYSTEASLDSRSPASAEHVVASQGPPVEGSNQGSPDPEGPPNRSYPSNLQSSTRVRAIRCRDVGAFMSHCAPLHSSNAQVGAGPVALPDTSPASGSSAKGIDRRDLPEFLRLVAGAVLSSTTSAIRTSRGS